ncbi:hypothetical protein [Streptomyces sp. NRRL B-1347]|uniref:hypothetical protein n=1 Tax=Streptomyces sp. NRRL B-1347 TaxID=1476877 RepID=UPI0004CA54B0|nr:hypothetical protein [Streptomyces sp. NRRL B-1347]
MSSCDSKDLTPRVGFTVHYVSHGTPVREDGTQAFTPACRAAIVTEVDEDDPFHLGLCVLNPTGQFFHPLAAGGCHFSDEPREGGTWHWIDD